MKDNWIKLLGIDDVVHIRHAIVGHHRSQWENTENSLLATVGRSNFIGIDVKSSASRVDFFLGKLIG